MLVSWGKFLLTHQVSDVHDVGTFDGWDGVPRSCRLMQDFQTTNFGDGSAARFESEASSVRLTDVL